MDHSPVEDNLRRIQGMMREKRFFDAMDLIRDSNRQIPDGRYERLMVECRFRHYLENPPKGAVNGDWPKQIPDAFKDVTGVPEINIDELTLETLSSGIRHHGALIVRGMIPQKKAQQLADGIDRAMAAREKYLENKSLRTPYYSQLPMEEDKRVGGRNFVETAGGIWTADSPRMLNEVTETFEKCGAIDCITQYFGERPVLSVSKSTLRRVPPTISHADWHQDGSFLGGNIRSVNIWLALSHCGKDASGLEVFPRRLDHIVPTGVGGANFKWSIGPETIAETVDGVGTESPLFAPGDAMIFDHLFLHRTGLPKGMTKDRYAIESWFFSPSAYPADTGPLWV